MNRDASDNPAVVQTAGEPGKTSFGPLWLRTTLRALDHRNYRLFFGGQFVSMTGTWMQRAAMSFLVWRITQSYALLGMVAFASQIPSFFIAPLAGVLADRWNRKRLLIITQSLAAIQAAVLAALTLTDVVQAWHLVALGMFMGVVTGFDVPIRQSFVTDMVQRRDDLPSAIALNSFLVNGSRLIGPAVGGLASLLRNEGVAFALNSATYLAVIAALAAMQVKPSIRVRHEHHVLRAFGQGLRYAMLNLPIRRVLALLAVTSLVGMSYMVLVPVFVTDVLGFPLAGSDGLHNRQGLVVQGLLLSAAGVGAVIGAVFLASRRNALGLQRLIALGPAVFGLTIIAFSASRNWHLSALLLVPTGFGTMLQIAGSNTLLQTIVDDDKRGRVMSFYTMCFMGMGPFGALLMSGLAHALGPPGAVALGGAACVAGSALFAVGMPTFERHVGPMFQHKGLFDVPADEAASGGVPVGKARNDP